MRITQVTVQMGRTISKNYNSFQNVLGLTANVTDDENHEEVIVKLQKQCLNNLLKKDPFDATVRQAVQNQIAAQQDKKNGTHG